MASLPPQSQLTFPLLELLTQRGPQSPQTLCTDLAALAGVSPDDTARTTPSGVRVWDRHVRWTEQQTRRRGWTAHPRRNTWAATPHGTALLGLATPGTITVALRRPTGTLVRAHALDVLAQDPADSVDLYLTSPPYLLLRAKAYGGPRSEADYLAWFLPFAHAMHRTLKDTGSLVLNLGLGPYLPGLPVRSPLVHRLVLALLDQVGFYLAGEHVWVNPSALPTPAEWANRRRVQVKDGYELVFWFSKTPHPHADNRAVLTPYSPAQQRVLAHGHPAARRPSGHTVDAGFARDNGGAIPSRVLTAAHTASNTAYLRACRAAGLPIHPARFPEALPDWWIRFLTQPGALVVDPFAGSATTAVVADRLGRRWKAIEVAGAYIEGAKLRWASA